MSIQLPLRSLSSHLLSTVTHIIYVNDLHKPRKLRLTSEGIDALRLSPHESQLVALPFCGKSMGICNITAFTPSAGQHTLKPRPAQTPLISLCHPLMAVMVLKSDGVNTTDWCKLIYPYSIARHLTKLCGSFIFNIACSTICVRVQRKGSQLYGCRQHSKVLIDMHIKLYYKHMNIPNGAILQLSHVISQSVIIANSGCNVVV